MADKDFKIDPALKGKAMDKARAAIGSIRYAVTLAGEFRVNGLGEVVSVHLAGCTFQPVVEPGMDQGTIEEMQENKFQLTVALIAQAMENLAMKEVEKKMAIELGLVDPKLLGHT